MIKRMLNADWNITRVIRLIIAVFFALNSVFDSDPVSGILAIFLFYQVITNTGCGMTGCKVPVYKDDTITNKKEMSL